MKTIKLHGSLRDIYPYDITVEAATAAEAISSLSCIPEFQHAARGGYIPVEAPGFQSKDALYSLTDEEVIDLYPSLVGAGGKAGGLQIIIGIVLIVAAITFPPAAAAGYGFGITQGAVVLAGAMMVLGGVLQMLAPTPSITSGTDKKSDYLGTAKNTVRIGTPIPMVFGRRRVYGHYISFDIDAKDSQYVKSSAASWTSIPGKILYANHAN